VHPGAVRAIGGIAGVEPKIDDHLGHRGPASERHGNSVGEGSAFDRGERELAHVGNRRDGDRSGLGDRRDRLAGIGSGRGDRTLIAPAAHLGTILGPLARDDSEGECGTGQPPLQGVAHVARGERRDRLELLLVSGRIVRIEQAFGQRGALAAEPAHFLKRADLARDDLGRGAGHFVRARAARNEIANHLVERRFGDGAIGPGLDVHVCLEEAEQFLLLVAGRNADGQLVAAHERVVEPRACQPAKDVEPHGQRGGVGVIDAGPGPRAGDAGDRHLVRHLAGQRCGQVDDRRRHGRHFGAARDRPEPFLHLGARGGDIDVPRQREHHVVGRVMVAEPGAHIGQAGRVEIGHRADRRMAIRVTDGQQSVADGVLGQTIRLVVALPLFILDHAALFIELVLRDRAEQVAHAVRFHHQRAVERAGGDRFDVVGAIVPGRSVGRGRTGRFEGNIEILDVLAAAEHQVLEQVGEPGASARFVLRSDAVVQRDADDRALAVGMNQRGQPVGEREAVVRYGDLADERAQRRGRGRGDGRRGGVRNRLDRRGGAGGEGQGDQAGRGVTKNHGGPRKSDANWIAD